MSSLAVLGTGLLRAPRELRLSFENGAEVFDAELRGRDGDGVEKLELRYGQIIFLYSLRSVIDICGMQVCR